MRRLLFAICCLGAIVLLAGCGKAVERPLQLGTVIWPGYEPLYLARSLGYFDESRVRLVEYTATTDTIEAYRNDALDMAALTLDEVLLLKQQGKDLRIILVTDISNGADVIVARSGIASMSGLKGKRIGVEASALGAYVLGRSLDLAGMKPEDIEVVPLQLGEHEAAFLEGKVEAVVTFEPVKTKLLNAGGKVIFDSSSIPNEIIDVLVVKPDYLKTHREEVSKVVKAWFKALAYLDEHKADAAQRIAGRLGISPEEFLASLDGLKLADRAINERMLGGNPPGIDANLKRLIGVMQAKALLRGAVNTDNMVDAGVLH